MDTLIGQVPDSWQVGPLSDTCAVRPGPSELRIDDRTLAGVPVVRPRNVKNGGLVDDGLGFVATPTAERLTAYQLVPDDVVCVRVGTDRRHALVRPQHAGWLLSSGCLRLRPSGELTGRYLNYYLGHPGVLQWLADKTTGAAIESVTAAAVGDLPLVLPPRVVQDDVADVLDALNQKIAAHTEIALATTKLRDTIAPALLSGALSP